MCAATLDRRFEAALDALVPLPRGARPALAFSGGRDSLALLVLLARVAGKRGWKPQAFVVDHRLRPESGREAERALSLSRALGVPCRVLRAESSNPGLGEAAARELRYRLLEAHAQASGCAFLLFAHHARDQAETLAMRAAAASGVRGLAGISAARATRGVLVLRPLLAFGEAELEGVVGQARLEPVLDPSNRDARFLRARLRADGSAPDVPAVRRLQVCRARVRCALEHEVARLFVRAVRITEYGVAELDVERLANAPESHARLALVRALMVVRGGHLAVRGRAAEALVMCLRSRRGATTLGGCRLVFGNASLGGRAFLVRELARTPRLTLEPRVFVGGTLSCTPSGTPSCTPSGTSSVIWDNRFRVFAPAEPLPEALVLAPLGEARSLLGRAVRTALPAAVVETLPALFFAGSGRLAAVACARSLLGVPDDVLTPALTPAVLPRVVFCPAEAACPAPFTLAGEPDTLAAPNADALAGAPLKG